MTKHFKYPMSVPNRKVAFYLILIAMCTIVVSGCADEAGRSEPLSYILPESWSIAEDRQLTEQHRKIAIMTSSGDFAEMELLQGDQVFDVDSRDYMTRYIKAAFPTGELQEKTAFEFGDVSRAGKNGYFINVSAPGKTLVEFTIEFYQFSSEKYNLFVVFTIDPNLIADKQLKFDQFLNSIKLGE